MIVDVILGVGVIVLVGVGVIQLMATDFAKIFEVLAVSLTATQYVPLEPMIIRPLLPPGIGCHVGELSASFSVVYVPTLY